MASSFSLLPILTVTWSVPQTGQGTNSFFPIASNSKRALHCGQMNSIDAVHMFCIVLPPDCLDTIKRLKVFF